MDDDFNVTSSARQGLLTAAVLVGVCVVLVATAAVFVLMGGDDSDVPRERLAALRAATTPEPVPPAGAVLLRRQEATGDAASDGSAIEWEYAYAGTPAEFVAHYRRVLSEAGWQEQVPGNSPDQIANFTAGPGAGRVILVLFAPGTKPNYRLLALG